jgi:5,10-methylenetetrahydromethanopterin reductase
MDDYVDILRALWRGEHVAYDGPVGTFEDLSFAERYHGDPPPVWCGGYCNPRGARSPQRSATG